MLGKAGLHPDIVKDDVHVQVLKNWRAHYEMFGLVPD
jgi:hypothetical protein